MRILIDYHHNDLLLSLHYLLEHRLGHELYVLWGKDWFNKGLWLIGRPYTTEIQTAKQFLEFDTPPDGSERLKSYFADTCIIKKMTWEEFNINLPDIIMVSYIDHIYPYWQLAKEKKIKYIIQIGNNWSARMNFKYVPNLLASTKPFDVPPGTNSIFYRQEFDLKLFSFGLPAKRENKISSFVQLFDHNPDKQWAYNLEKCLPEYQFNFYGQGSRNGHIQGHKNLVKIMHENKFGLHLKPGGDGMGHIIHNLFATGTVPIVKYEYYKNCLAGELMVDEQTCLFIDNLTPEEVAIKIKKYEILEILAVLGKRGNNDFRYCAPYIPRHRLQT